MKKKIIGYKCAKAEAEIFVGLQISPETNECLEPIYEIKNKRK